MREDELEKTLVKCVADFLDSKDYIESLEKEYQCFYERAHLLQEELVSMKRSMAWKLTAPLRALHNFFCGIPKEYTHPELPKLTQIQCPVARLLPPPFAYHGKRIGVDVTALYEWDNGTGIQRVVREIATHLSSTSIEDEIVLIDMKNGWPIDVTFHFFPNQLTQARFGIPCLQFNTIFLLDASWSYLKIMEPIIQAARSSGVRVISCLYDLIPVDYPESCEENNRSSYIRWLSRAISWSDGFICISRAVAKRLKEYFASIGITDKTIEWWHLGNDFAKIEKNVIDPIIKSEYALVVGTLEPRKNHALALKAFEEGWSNGSIQTSLVFAGKKGWKMDEFIEKIKNHSEWGKRLFWCESPTDQDLVNLYYHSKILLQTSYAEGFGLPIIEGGGYNKPIVLTDIPVFREIVLENGYFFRTGDADDLQRALCESLQPGSRKTKVLNKTWKESAKELKEVLQKELQ